MSSSTTGLSRGQSMQSRVGFAAVALAVVLAALVGGVATTPVVGAAEAPTSFVVNGSGWGHGVGMSQYGARGMAIGGSNSTDILTHYYRGTEVVSTTERAGHKVLVAPSAASFTFTVGTGLEIAATGGAAIGTAGPGSTVTVTRFGAGVGITGAISGYAPSLSIRFTGPVRISPPNHKYVYGSITVDPTGTSLLNTRIVGITMTQLLYGLGEMPSLWPTEALKTQAIAARTFAQKRAIAGGDLRAWMDISYVGYDKETGGSFDRWKAAVDGTVGRVVTYNGGLIDALFSASSGGYTENSEYVFISALPFLRGIPDPGDLVAGNPFASWTRTFTADELGSWFGVGKATAVQILGTLGVSGRTNKATIRVVGTTGTKDQPSLTFRNIIASNSSPRALISPKFSITALPASPTTVPPTSPPTTSPATTVPPTTPPPAPRVPVMPVGVVQVAKAVGRTITMAGTASDPDGAPLIRVVSTMGTSSGTRDVRAAGGRWSISWTGTKGTRKVCTSVLDTPTGRTVSLGCRNVIVK